MEVAIGVKTIKNYKLKSAQLDQSFLLLLLGRTNLFYLPKYFRKGRKGGTEKGGGKDNLTRLGQLSYG